MHIHGQLKTRWCPGTGWISCRVCLGKKVEIKNSPKYTGSPQSRVKIYLTSKMKPQIALLIVADYPNNVFKAFGFVTEVIV